jgi:two-component system, NarL family, invasion response regulator UvrY
MTRIYMVDDHELVRDGLRAMLEAGGHTVVGVADEPARALAEVLQLAPDLLLLDLNLAQGGSGLDLLTELRRRALPVRTLVLTISARPQDVATAVQLGAAGYLLKNSSRADLLAAIEAVMSGKSVLGRDVGELALRALQGDHEADRLALLSPRERQILAMVVRGQTSPAIGERLHLSPNTVDTYRSRIMVKLGLDDLPALVRFAIRAGVIDTDGN